MTVKLVKKGIKKRQKGRLGRCSGWVRETRAQNSLSVPPGRAHFDLGQYQRQIHLIITFAGQNLIKSIQTKWKLVVKIVIEKSSCFDKSVIESLSMRSSNTALPRGKPPCWLSGPNTTSSSHLVTFNMRQMCLLLMSLFENSEFIRHALVIFRFYLIWIKRKNMNLEGA